jgi:hypothetical protein
MTTKLTAGCLFAKKYIQSEASSTNIQAPEKHQIPNADLNDCVHWTLMFEASLEFGAWGLEL